MKKIKRFLYFVFLLTLVVTFFTRDNYRGVDNINPELLSEPIQTELENKDVFRFTKDDYQYELAPLYNYELNGLIVHKLDYTWFSIYKRDSVFPMDLCIIWGDNVKNRVYQDKALKFSQDMRFCRFEWRGKLDFNGDEVSNNHLVVESEELEEKIKKLSTGDQVKIKGKLVSIKAENVGEPGKYDPEYFEWGSSVTRADSGGGACETIYVEDVEILQKGNPISGYLYKISLYGLMVLIGLGVLNFLFALVRPV